MTKPTLSADNLVVLAKRVHLEYRANVGSCWTGLERLVLAALDGAMVARDREWREALGVEERYCPHPAFAKTWLRSSVSEAVAEERKRREQAETALAEATIKLRLLPSEAAWQEGARMMREAEQRARRAEAALAAREAKS
jgi:hypothetical protein